MGELLKAGAMNYQMSQKIVRKFEKFWPQEFKHNNPKQTFIWTPNGYIEFWYFSYHYR